MEELLRQYFRKARTRMMQAVILESAVLGLAAFFLTATAAHFDQLNPLSPAALTCEFVSAFALALTWLRASRKRLNGLVQRVDRQLEAEGRISAAYSILQQPSTYTSVQSLCLSQALKWVDNRPQPTWSSYFNSSLVVAPVFALLIALATGGVGEKHSPFSIGDRDVVSQIEESEKSLAESELKEKVGELRASLQKFESGQLTRAELRTELQNVHQQLGAVEKELIRQESRPDLARSIGSQTSGQKLAKAMGSLERAIRALPEAGSESSQGQSAGNPADSKAGVSTFSPGKPESEAKTFGNYQWPSRFDAVVKDYFENQH